MELMFREGDVVCCHHLHDEKAPPKITGPNKDGDYDYHVEGKARPVLVLGPIHRIWLETAIDTNEPVGKGGCTLYKASGSLGYMVLPLQSDPPPRYVPFEPCPGLVRPGKISYVDLRPVCYPVECLVAKIESVGPLRLKPILDRLSWVRPKFSSRVQWYRA